MPNQHAPGDEALDDDDLPPLLLAWERFRKNVLGQDGKPALDDNMLTFMAGATVITALVRSAAAQGGASEATRAFVSLCEECDSFETVLMRRGRRH
jgi:hypothetical protein